MVRIEFVIGWSHGWPHFRLLLHQIRHEELIAGASGAAIGTVERIESIFQSNSYKTCFYCHHLYLDLMDIVDLRNDR